MFNEKQMRQIEMESYKREPYINRAKIKEFLSELSYPLYFLDFETFQQAIPEYDGVSPYMQIPFQYSLHILNEEDGELKHKEFLGTGGEDPRLDLVKQLCIDIPENVCTLAFNMGFEKGVLTKLAENYPDYSEHLLNIKENIKDLMIPFKDYDYYNREQMGSYSIKKVLPALCKDDPELDYKSLDGIHNGSEAMNAFAELKWKSEEETEKIRRSLLAYCKLDTLAMVKILDKLRDLII